ncbi:MAG: hypothetical protein ACI9W4_001817 [Rhodothermales bacterium]
MAISFLFEFTQKVATQRDIRALLSVGTILLCCFGTGCRNAEPGRSTSVDTVLVSLQQNDVLVPDRVLSLPRALREISGLVVTAEGSLLALQDEAGDVFEIDSESGAIVRRIRFAGDGDFEALTLDSSRALLFRSDGRVYSGLLPQSDEEVDGKRHNVDLHGSCDVESADVRPDSDELWIGCKESPGKRMGRTRAFYAVTLSELRDTKGKVAPRLTARLEPPTDPRTGSPMRLGLFKPSGMAFLDHDRFLVLSSVYPTMFEFHTDGRLLNSWGLPRDVLPQPEGIAVDGEGRVYIASEGFPGRIAVFNHLSL